MNIKDEMGPWLKIAEDLEALDQFLNQKTPGDYVLSKAKHIRAIAQNPWTWKAWKVERIAGEIQQMLHNFHRRIAEGFFFGMEGAASGVELHSRIAEIELAFKALRELK